MQTTFKIIRQKYLYIVISFIILPQTLPHISPTINPRTLTTVITPLIFH